MKRAELEQLKKLQKDLRLGKKISEADADSYYDLLNKFGGLSLVRAGDSYCLCNSSSEKIESVELIGKILQPLIASAETAVMKEGTSTTNNMNQPNNALNTSSSPSEPPPSYSADDQQNKATETKRDNNSSNKAIPNQPNPQTSATISAGTSSSREQKNPPRPAMLTQFNPVAKPAPRVSYNDLEEFLRLVAGGEQNQAEAMLKNNPNLALVPGDVTDLSKRTFTNITAFQYSVWALDWHMWTMIRKYLPDEVAREQAQGFETGSWVKGSYLPWRESHGVHAQGLLDNLIQAYQTTIDLYNAKKYAEGDKAWVKQVGGAQLLLPTHVINEYCHPTRPFYPLPNFKDVAALPRSRTIDEGEWFTASYLGGKLGEKFACYRAGMTAAGVAVAGRGVEQGRELMLAGRCLKRVIWWVGDNGSVRELTSTRIAQREELIAELRPRSAQGLAA